MTAPARRSAWRELPFLVVLAVVLALILKATLVQAFSIPSGSMEQTLAVGDRVLVNKVVYDFRTIHRGEVVVFNGSDLWAKEGGESTSKHRGTVGSALHHVGVFFGFASDDKDYIKRVIGLPGDRVMCCSARGNVVVTPAGGQPVELTEPYLYDYKDDSYKFFCAAGSGESSCPPGSEGVLIPKGRLFVLGDHRGNSADSRFSTHFNDKYHGTISESKVVGRAFVVVYPVQHWKVLGVPTTFTAGLALPGSQLVLGGVLATPVTLLRRRRIRR